MSAQSRALRGMATHMERLRDEAKAWERDRLQRRVSSPPIYTASDAWERARDMCARSADELTWRSRTVRFVRRRMLRSDVW